MKFSYILFTYFGYRYNLLKLCNQEMPLNLSVFREARFKKCMLIYLNKYQLAKCRRSVVKASGRRLSDTIKVLVPADPFPFNPQRFFCLSFYYTKLPFLIFNLNI